MSSSRRSAGFTDPIDPKVAREFQQSTLARPVPPEFFETIVSESLKVPARVWKAALEPYLTVDFSDRLNEIVVTDAADLGRPRRIHAGAPNRTR